MIEILLAEDNHVNQIVATQMLEKFGCNVECANNGVEAIEMAKAKDYDAIIMDCQMPEMDGYQATRELKSMAESGELKKTPIIAFTAHAMEADKEKCFAAGMDDYLSKPVDEDRLKEVVEKWAGKKASDSEEEEMPVVETQYIEQETIFKLKSIMGDGFSALLAAFDESVNDLINQMGEAISNKDFNKLSKLAHTIKSPASQLGAKKLSEASLDLEVNAEKNSLDENAEAVLKIQDLFNGTSKEIKSSSF